ncbi:MAG TPA: hypothetical protein PKZ93_11355 [Spirochaetota bacterium]|nr:hypothetical protein [Spirochaetota bacterium]
MKNGGAAMLLKEQLLEKHPEIMKNKKCRILAVENAFISSVKGESIYKSAGISAEDVVKNVLLEEDPLN